MLTLQQLVTPATEDEVLDTLLTALSQLGFQATSWQTGSIQLVTLRVFARVIAAFSTTQATIAAGGFTTLAAVTTGTSAFMTLIASYFYAVDRLEAQATIGQVLLTSSATAGTNTWGVGDIIVSDSPSGTTGARTYTNTEAGSLGPDSTLSVEFQSTVAGDDGNIAPATTLYMWTTLNGVSATIPALVPDSNTWVTTPGSDEESNARLLLRCLGRWERLTYGNTNGAYVGWALEALPALTRVSVAGAAGDGTVRIIGATALGGLTAGQITTIEDYVNGVADGVGRRPQNDIVTVESADEVSTALDVVAYVVSSALLTAGDDITAALLTFNGEQPIGGVRLQGTQGRILFDDLLETAKRANAGIRSVTLSISSDVLLDPNQIYTPVVSVDVQLVAPGTR